MSQATAVSFSIMPGVNLAVLCAARLFIARKNRNAHPVGHTKSGSRWYPSVSEIQPCCAGIRAPSRAYPWSLAHHCRTAAHVAELCGVDVAGLRKVAREIEKTDKPA